MAGCQPCRPAVSALGDLIAAVWVWLLRLEFDQQLQAPDASWFGVQSLHDIIYGILPDAASKQASSVESTGALMGVCCCCVLGGSVLGVCACLSMQSRRPCIVVCVVCVAG